MSGELSGAGLNFVDVGGQSRVVGGVRIGGRAMTSQR